MANKKRIEDQTVFEHSHGLMTFEQINSILEKVSKVLISKTIARYTNGLYSHIFNENDLTGMANELIKMIGEGVAYYQQDPKHPEAINPRGMINYFKKSFINRTIKEYKKYAKTQKRAGVMTISSDEALTVAAAKNLVYPENNFILHQEILTVLDKLKGLDNKRNEETKRRHIMLNKPVSSNDLSYNYDIVFGLLNGEDAKEMAAKLSLSPNQYSKHKNTALIYAKKQFSSKYSDLIEHFNDEIDKRIYVNDSHSFDQKWKFMVFIETKENEALVKCQLINQELKNQKEKAKEYLESRKNNIYVLEKLDLKNSSQSVNDLRNKINTHFYDSKIYEIMKEKNINYNEIIELPKTQIA